jgi:hypothetical protein
MKYILTFFVSAFLILLAYSVSYNSPNQFPLSNAFYVIPPNYSGTAGGAGFLGPLSNAQRTYQLLIHDSILSALDGQELKGITWRLLPSAGSSWPASAITFSSYDIYLSESVPPANRSLTFAQNVVGTQKLVRSGALNIAAGTYPSGGNPNLFGAEITFDSSYLYTGGHLLIEIRHMGFTGSSTSVDAAGTSAPGYAFLFSACWTGSYTGTSGSQGNFAVVRITGDSPTSTGNQSEVAGDFTLKQNYPNPFNPVTNITFTMPRAGVVALKVYDVTGNEVMTLIDDEQLTAGTKSQFFEGSGLGSGVYFYTLYIDNNKIDTKKMILVK